MNINIHINIEKHAMRPPTRNMPLDPPHKNKAMRSHPQSPFGKAWAAHFKAANLARLSDEEKRVEYNRFSAEWAPVHGPDAHR